MKLSLFLLAAVAGSLCAPAMANLNVPVASRVVSFTQAAPTGSVTAAIIFEPGNAASEAEAANIEQKVGSGLLVGRATIKVRRVAAGSLGNLAGARIAFVTSGIREQGDIAAVAARNSVLTITSDLSCVQAARCVVAITGGSQPQITVNRAAAKAANIRFGSAFLMLVKEL